MADDEQDMTSVLSRRDTRVHGQVDFAPGATARQIADALGITPALVHPSLSRLASGGLVARSKTFPARWYLDLDAIPDTDEVEVTLTAGDCRFIVHMLRAMLTEGRAGEPTIDLIDRIERAVQRVEE